MKGQGAGIDEGAEKVEMAGGGEERAIKAMNMGVWMCDKNVKWTDIFHTDAWRVR